MNRVLLCAAVIVLAFSSLAQAEGDKNHGSTGQGSTGSTGGGATSQTRGR